MHSHLDIIGINGELALKPDTSLNVTDKNPMFNDVEMFTQTIPLPFDKNRHVLKNMDDVNSTMRSADVQGERFQFVLDGIPFRNTAIKIQEGTKLDGTIDVNFDATNRTFKDMIADLRCRDVTVDDDILIGEKIDRLKVTGHVKEMYHLHFFDPDTSVGWSDFYITGKVTDIGAEFSPIATDYSFPARCQGSFIYPDQDTPKEIAGRTVKVPLIRESYINTSVPYGVVDANGKRWPYCNSRICYAHHDIEYEETNGQKTPKVEDGSYITSDAIVQSDKNNPADGYDFSPYWLLPADRSTSGICFYVGYFLERLFKTLGVGYDMSALTSIEDFNYLCFFSTQCHFVTRTKPQSGGKILKSEEEINAWLENRGLGGRISMECDTDKKDVTEIYLLAGEWTSIEYSDNYPSRYKWHIDHETGEVVNRDYNPETDSFYAKIQNYGTNPPYGIYSDDSSSFKQYFEVEGSLQAEVMNMFATSDNFPDASVSEVIESLENSFGVRFVYDAEINKVTVKLLRDMFCDQQSPIPFKGKVLRMVKMTENIRGIRMKYSAEADEQEQRDNIRYGVRDYDTDYDYSEYPQDRTFLKQYSDIIKLIDIGNMNCYVDMNTGDAFRVKVSSEASTVTELRPTTFEVGGHHGVEIGDCSKDAEADGAIKEFVSNFEPITNNILKDTDGKMFLVPFIDEDMEHEFVTKKIQNAFSVGSGEDDYVYLNYTLNSLQAYDPSKTDDGNSPLQNHDWGLTIGILRPAVNGGGVFEYDRNYDGFDNSRWSISSDDYAITSDTMDVFGTFYGTSDAGSFSLKPRAWKPFRYKYVTESGQQVLKISTNPKQWENEDGWLIPCIEDERNVQGIITKRIRSRGMCDTWMIEFFHFLLNRQKYYVEALCTAAELADIPNNWLRRWEIDGKVGWINMTTYPINVETGLGKVEMEFYAL